MHGVIPSKALKVMVQVKLVFLVQTMMAYRESKCVAAFILNLGTGWRWMVNIMPLPLPMGRNPGPNWVGGWVGLCASLYMLEKNLLPLLDSKTRPFSP